MEEVISRSFQVLRLGTYNCDAPIFQQGTTPVYASYRDKSGKTLYPKTVYIAYKGFNGIYQQEARKIRVDRNAEQMMWAVIDEKLAYIKEKDFKKTINLSGNAGSDFVMNIHNQKLKSVQEIRELFGT